MSSSEDESSSNWPELNLIATPPYRNLVPTLSSFTMTKFYVKYPLLALWKCIGWYSTGIKFRKFSKKLNDYLFEASSNISKNASYFTQMLTCQAASCSILQVDPSEYYVNRYTQENLEAFDLDSYLPSNKSTLPEIQRIPELDFKIFRAVYIKIIKNHDKNVSGMGQMGMTYADIPHQSLAPDYPVFQKYRSEWNCFMVYLYFFSIILCKILSYP